MGLTNLDKSHTIVISVVDLVGVGGIVLRSEKYSLL